MPLPSLRRLNRRRLMLLLGLLLIGAGLLGNPSLLTALFSADGQLAPRSVVIIWLLDAGLIGVGLVLALSRSFTTLLNVLVGLGLTGLLLFGAEKLFYRLNHPPPAANAPPPPPAIQHEGTYTHGFFQPDERLGYTVQPEAQFTSIKKLGDDLVYDVVYTIDHHHRRVTPVANSTQRSKFILFFGDSFTFGEGVNDDETLPYHVGQLAPDYQPYNYGLSGYGPQQMLAKLQSNDLSQEVAQPDGLAIYVFIDAHVERAIGSMYVYNAWGDEMPYYTLTWQNDLVRRGSFRSGRPLISTLYKWLGQSEMARYYNINIPARLTARHYGFTARLIAEARTAFLAQYPGGAFYVVIYPDEGDYVEDMIPHFERLDLTYLNYDEELSLKDENLGIVGDGHPTGRAHEIVAGWIVEDLGLTGKAVAR